MAAIENEHAYAIQLRESVNDGSDFGSADADYRRLFLGEDGRIRLKDAAGVVTEIGGAEATAASKLYLFATCR